MADIVQRLVPTLGRLEGEPAPLEGGITNRNYVARLGGVRYVLTGGGGSALFPSGNDDRFHHYLTVEVTSTSVKERVHMLDGKVFHIPQGLVLLPTHDEKKRRWWELA